MSYWTWKALHYLAPSFLSSLNPLPLSALCSSQNKSLSCFWNRFLTSGLGPMLFLQSEPLLPIPAFFQVSTETSLPWQPPPTQVRIRGPSWGCPLRSPSASHCHLLFTCVSSPSDGKFWAAGDSPQHLAHTLLTGGSQRILVE